MSESFTNVSSRRVHKTYIYIHIYKHDLFFLTWLSFFTEVLYLGYKMPKSLMIETNKTKDSWWNSVICDFFLNLRQNCVKSVKTSCHPNSSLGVGLPGSTTISRSAEEQSCFREGWVKHVYFWYQFEEIANFWTKRWANLCMFQFDIHYRLFSQKSFKINWGRLKLTWFVHVFYGLML